ncbi:anthranilate synthase component II [Vulcanisaeta souniana]|uniref:anthranilate synthase n=1 Tax=Vulcanisaeta souniana JCM 11219 TaxID=1293586 RepID=A0A830E0J1_9CREN|nr:aminodeoxychorismate/anthranilate synthase component II [Vulcanisaeta souniana]BDR92352.1 aminodeoxychorismate/anthranilate synthase component II [Vulcanisaeta souniana JCM 11219]GGI74908.1 aminodeoxychorismate/anthranilate synthase component II [Vulcanisaeta souniana JCM 11219]
MELVVIIDNYDSFTYNIAQYTGELGAKPLVFRNDEVTVRVIERLRPDGIIISPGPGNPLNPRDVGVSRDVIKHFGGKVPILGVCLGHQVIGAYFGARVRRARTIKHGKTSIIRTVKPSPIFQGLPEVLEGMRYHSLVIDDLPSELIVTAISEDDNEVMAIQHREYPIFGVQFHPESIGTPTGKRILRNFLNL